jgi:hypothetical protein
MVDKGKRQGKGDGKTSGCGSSCHVKNGGDVNFCSKMNGGGWAR